MALNTHQTLGLQTLTIISQCVPVHQKLAQLSSLHSFLVCTVSSLHSFLVCTAF